MDGSRAACGRQCARTSRNHRCTGASTSCFRPAARSAHPHALPEEGGGARRPRRLRRTARPRSYLGVSRPLRPLLPCQGPMPPRVGPARGPAGARGARAPPASRAPAGDRFDVGPRPRRGASRRAPAARLRGRPRVSAPPHPEPRRSVGASRPGAPRAGGAGTRRAGGVTRSGSGARRGIAGGATGDSFLPPGRSHGGSHGDSHGGSDRSDRVPDRVRGSIAGARRGFGRGALFWVHALTPVGVARRASFPWNQLATYVRALPEAGLFAAPLAPFSSSGAPMPWATPPPPPTLPATPGATAGEGRGARGLKTPGLLPAQVGRVSVRVFLLRPVSV